MYQPFIGRKEELDALENYMKQRDSKWWSFTDVGALVNPRYLVILSEEKSYLLHGSPQWSPTEFATLEPASPWRLGSWLKYVNLFNVWRVIRFSLQQMPGRTHYFHYRWVPLSCRTSSRTIIHITKYIDTEWMQGNMYLILCGSSISFMEEEVLSEKVLFSAGGQPNYRSNRFLIAKLLISFPPIRPLKKPYVTGLRVVSQNTYPYCGIRNL